MKHSDWLWDVRRECDACIGHRSIYLTFDDGPHPLCTPQILNLLAEHRVPATFFVIGTYALGQPELIQRMVAEGHEVGNHTMTHPDLSRCGFDEVQREIFDANAAIMMACPQASVRHLRAPYGNWTEEVFAASAIAELAAIKWSVDPCDWSRPGVDTIVDAVLESAKPGAIVRLHDGFPPDELVAVSGAGLRDQTVMAVSRLIPALLERGFQIRSLPHFD
ncbi:Chitooligosaccharide deacetylase [Mesorhizobium plurifarium]|uniref:Chitooligosaccharide deacetylase n=1 Tax=Mesorhizobium plurifarium TaxID=69974 RepID=A0A090FZH7_MESPL|nr:Chitooligosaccharide deacetylase [Mesorhizobium plurifarium]